MFSGLIQSRGVLADRNGSTLWVEAPQLRARAGDSIAVDGVCLTVTARKGWFKPRYAFDLSPETLERTTLGQLALDTPVNLESALKVSDALGGHLVQGHVDGVGRLVERRESGENHEFWFEAPAELLVYAVPKGSITVDGVSLTIVGLEATRFSVALIPFTLSHTNLGAMKLLTPVNLEADIMAKYVRKYTQHP